MILGPTLACLKDVRVGERLTVDNHASLLLAVRSIDLNLRPVSLPLNSFVSRRFCMAALVHGRYNHSLDSTAKSGRVAGTGQEVGIGRQTQITTCERRK